MSREDSRIDCSSRESLTLYNMLFLSYSVGGEFLGGSDVWSDVEDVKRLCRGLESMPHLLELWQVIE